MNNAAVNMGTQIPVGIESWKSLLSILLGLDLGVELLDRTVTLFHFLRKHPIDPRAAAPLYMPTSHAKRF